MDIALILIAAGALNLACFFLGAKIGQTVAKGEPIEVSVPDPLKAVREHQSRKEAQREQDRYETIMRNIENYDGTEHGQEDVPGR